MTVLKGQSERLDSAEAGGGQGAPVPGDPPLYFQKHVFCCVNERPAGDPRGCCMERGALKLRAYMKLRAKELGLTQTRINNAGCLDRCELGPTMVIYPEGIWYSYHSKKDIEEILQEHLLRGRRVERLLLRPEDKEPRQP